MCLEKKKLKHMISNCILLVSSWGPAGCVLCSSTRQTEWTTNGTDGCSTDGPTDGTGGVSVHDGIPHHACGYEHPCQFTMDDVEMNIGDKNLTQSLAAIYKYHKTKVPFEGVEKLKECKHLGGGY